MPKTMSFPSEQNRSVQLESPTHQKDEKEDSSYSDWSELGPNIYSMTRTRRLSVNGDSSEFGVRRFLGTEINRNGISLK